MYMVFVITWTSTLSLSWYSFRHSSAFLILILSSCSSTALLTVSSKMFLTTFLPLTTWKTFVQVSLSIVLVHLLSLTLRSILLDSFSSKTSSAQNGRLALATSSFLASRSSWTAAATRRSSSGHTSSSSFCCLLLPKLV